MSGSLIDLNTEDEWEQTAKKLFATGPVGIMEVDADGNHTIFARVTGFVNDPTYGRLIQVQRVGAKPTTPDPYTGFSSTAEG